MLAWKHGVQFPACKKLDMVVQHSQEVMAGGLEVQCHHWLHRVSLNQHGLHKNLAQGAGEALKEFDVHLMCSLAS